MPDLKGPPAELRATVTITRAATGKVETFDLIGFTDPDKLAEYQAAQTNHPQENDNAGSQ